MLPYMGSILMSSLLELRQVSVPLSKTINCHIRGTKKVLIITDLVGSKCRTFTIIYFVSSILFFSFHLASFSSDSFCILVSLDYNCNITEMLIQMFRTAP